MLNTTLRSQPAKIKSGLNTYLNQPGRHGVWLMALVLLLIALPYMIDDSARACTKVYRQDTIVEIGTHKLAAEIANQPEERTKGLSGRDCIGSQQAMLFSFEKPGIYPFWMKDMRFPIDIVWLSSDMQVVKIEMNAEPSSYPKKFANDQPAQYVLELQAGQAEALAIKIGTTIKF